MRYFQHILDSRAKLYSNILEINTVISRVKQECGLDMAQELTKIIDESVLTTNLHVSWLTRRLRRNSLKQLFSLKEPKIEFNHCLIFEEVRRRRINYIFSFDDALKTFGIPLMPQV